MEVGLRPGDFVLDGNPAPRPSQKEAEPRGGAPNFRPMVYCGQTAGWIKMTRGMEVGPGPVHIVLDEDTSLLPKRGGGAEPPILGPSLLWPNGWMRQDATWYECRPQPR